MNVYSLKHISNEYRYGFQGQELDNEIKGEGNSINYKYRMHDPRVGRFFAVDPLAPDYPWNSPYAFSENSTIAFIELEGLERYYSTDGTFLGQVGDNSTVRVATDNTVSNEVYSQMISDVNRLKSDTYTPAYNNILLNKSVTINEYAEGVTDVLGDVKAETWGGNGKNCNAAARKQMARAGVETNGSSKVIQTKVDNSKQTDWVKKDGTIKKRGNLNENKMGGTIYIMTQLKKGNPVMIGVETYPHDVGNFNAITTHFIVANSMTVDANGNITIGYYDNASGTDGKNKSENNQLQLDTNTGSLTEQDTEAGYSSYEVTEVRTNVEASGN